MTRQEQDGQEQDGVTAKQIVDTLFGPDEAVFDREGRGVSIDELYPAFSADPDGQEILPLSGMTFGEPVVVEEPNLSFLTPYLDELRLFEKRWGFVKGGETREEWCLRMREEVAPVLNELTKICSEEEIMHPQGVYTYVSCAAEGETLFLFPNGETEAPRALNFPRLANGACLCDRFKTLSGGGRDALGLIAVNLGTKVYETVRLWTEQGQAEDAKLLDGYAVEMAYALTGYVASMMGAQGVCVGNLHPLGVSKEGNAKDQSVLIKLVQARNIGISFSGNYRMTPEYAALALLLPR